MDSERVMAGIGCFILTLMLCCCGGKCETQHNEHDMSPAVIDMMNECIPCSQSLPGLNCVPSLCAQVGSMLCCVR